MATVLVTGANGFIGLELCKKLKRNGHYVLGVDLFKVQDTSHLDYFIDVDITKPEDMHTCINWQTIDYIYHLAAMANINYAKKYPRRCFDVNVIGTFNIVQIADEYKIPICYISTQCVYGNQDVHPVTEESLPMPTEIYAITKLMGEQLLALLENYVILRYGTVIGPSMRDALATHIFLKKAEKQEPIPIEGSGEQTRDWIYIDDLVDATAMMIDMYNEKWDWVNKEIFNISGKHSYSVLDMARMCWKIVNGNEDIKIKFLPDRFGQIFKEDVSIDKAKILGWEPKIGLYEALEKSYNAWKND
jgi:nucleoside-diphosphate-sugar epimerase